MIEPENRAANGGAFLFGVALHQLVFRWSEWDGNAINILGATLIFNVISTVGLLRLLPQAYSSIGAAASDCMQLTVFAILGIYASILIYRTFFHRLNPFPGPFAARLSNFYPTYLSAKRLHLYEETERLHKKYGDYVRLGPRELSITDPKASAIIHAPASPCTKGPWYDVLLPLVSLHMCRSRPEHARRRKAWDRGFTSKALKGYEPRVANYTDQLVQKIEEREGQPMDMAQWFNFYSFDVMGDLAFGKSFGMLQRGTTHYFMSSLHGFMKNVGLFSHLVWLFPIFKKTPILNAEEKQFWVFVNQQVDERRKVCQSRHRLLRVPNITR
jgi:cytochrome P450 family 628